MLRRVGRAEPATRATVTPLRRVASPTAPPVEVRVEAEVEPAAALAYLCDASRWTRFQGRAASLDPRPGGRLRIDLGDGVVMAGSYTEIVAGARVAFTWGRPGDPAMPEGSSAVAVDAEALPGGRCALVLTHSGLPDRAVADAHRSGWRYHLQRLAVAAGGATGDDEVVDLFLAAANEPDPGARRGLLERTCAPDVVLGDEVGQVVGLPALESHLGRGAVAAPTRRVLRTTPLQRVASLARCRYEVAEAGADGPVSTSEGELLVAFDRSGKLAAASRFRRAASVTDLLP